MNLDATLSQAWAPQGDAWTFDVPAGWGQGRSVFGGVSAALTASLARPLVPAGRQLRSASLTLLRPTAAGQVTGEANLLREGKSTSFVRAELRQDSGTTVLADLVYVLPRPERLAVSASKRWEGPPVESLQSAPFIEGVMPQFLQHVDLRWASGSYPYSGGTEARFSGYVRFRDRIGDAEGVLALLDVWPCPSLSMLSQPAPASTVSWTAHILETPAHGTDWFGFEYETVVGSGGFHTVVGRLYGPGGQLIAWTEQLVAVFA